MIFKRKIVLIPLILIGLIFILIVNVDWEEDTPEPNLDVNFPLPDYLYKDSQEEKREEIETNNPPKDEFKDTKEILQQVQEEVQEQIEKIKKQTNNPSNPLILLQNPNQTSSEQIQNPQNLKHKRNKNDRFIFTKATEEEKQQNDLLSQRIISFNSQSNDDAKENYEYGVDGFSNFERKDIGTNEHKLLRTITADRMIPAFLVTPISSGLSGKVVAQTETNIYGTMGRAVLIPKGSKVIGYYVNNNKIGEYRLQVVWTRIITPQGIHILLTNARGGDVKGYSGLVGEVVSRNFEKYGIPILVSTLSNGLLLATSSFLNAKAGQTGNFLGQYALTKLSNTIRNDISAVVDQILRDNAKLNPIIIIKEGSRVFISPNTDIFIPIPKKKEVLAEFFKEPKPQEEEDLEIGDE